MYLQWDCSYIFKKEWQYFVFFFRGLGRLTGFCNSGCDRYKLLTLPRSECTELFWHPDWWSSCLSSGPGQKQQKKKCANELKKCEGQGPKVSRWMQPRDRPDCEQYKTNGYERDKAQQRNRFTACFGHLYPEGWDEQKPFRCLGEYFTDPTCVVPVYRIAIVIVTICAVQ